MSEHTRSDQPEQNSHAASPRQKTLERILLLIRWLQLPLLLGLLVMFIIFEITFVTHLIDLITDDGPTNRTKVILVTLDLIDMVLIANLIVIVIISGYKIFISPLIDENDPSVPKWLRSATPAEVKLRIATTILLISTIHLLHVFLDPSKSNEQDANFMLIAQAVFGLTTLVFVVVEYFEREEK